MTTLNTTTLASIQLSQVIEQLKDMDTQTVIDIYNSYADENSYERIYDNDDETINDLYQDASDALRAAFFGDYNHSHDYFVLNGYGNLQSFEYVTDENCPIDIEELAEWISNNELFNDYDIEVTTLDNMLASIEDNITDDENMLNKLSKYYNISLMVESQTRLNGLLDLLTDCDYSQLNDIITHLNIEYNK